MRNDSVEENAKDMLGRELTETDKAFIEAGKKLK